MCKIYAQKFGGMNKTPYLCVIITHSIILNSNLMKKNKFNINEMNVVNSEAEAPKSTIKSRPSKRKLKAAKNSNKSWLYIQSSDKYRNHVAIETCRRITESLKSELYDGMSIVLNERNCAKSEKMQKRIMRRIIEKRQAQATHHKLGRTTDMFVPSIERANVSRCMYEFA